MAENRRSFYFSDASGWRKRCQEDFSWLDLPALGPWNSPLGAL